ncbi:MAG: phosphatase PAP2 family protein, partial [Candidatus Thermoplasmatota archaeon]
WLADRVTLSIAWVYILAVPFYLFFNVRVTGDTIPGMETLAYSLTPEIADWFRRIDPFTNGMPSLHIGIPFAVWLCLTRFDDDRRWNRYRYTVFVYTLLTAFTIIYLGIHWFVDIIGGMLIAGAAVSMADRTSNGWWKFFDERTMNARIVTVLTRPGQAWTWLRSRLGRAFQQYRSPTSRETGHMAVIILVVVAAVITWDLTHRSLPAGGVEAPEAAAASDEWLATLDNQSEGVSLLLQNLSAADSMSVGVDVPGLSLDSTHALRQDVLAVANGSSLLIYDVHQPDRALSVFEFEQPEHLLVCERGSSLVVVYTLDGVLNVMDLQGQPIPFSDEVHDGVERLTCSGSEIAYVTAERPMEVTVLQLGVRGEVGYTINATAPQEEDAILEAWGTPVDMANATVQSMAFDREYLAVTVNVSATDRLVLYNRSTAEQWLASNAKYHVSDISLDHGILAWSVRDHLNPLAPQDKYLDREIYFTELDTNTSYVLTSDYKDQWGPLVLEHQLVYFELDDDVMSMEIHAWEPELRLYSSIVLQAGVLLAFFVVAWNMWQRQSERRLARQP